MSVSVQRLYPPVYVVRVSIYLGIGELAIVCVIVSFIIHISSLFSELTNVCVPLYSYFTSCYTPRYVGEGDFFRERGQTSWILIPIIKYISFSSLAME